MAGEAVAWFEIRVAGDDLCEAHGSIEICGNEQFYLGRDTELCRYCWSDDLTISRQHLRVHCILYEQDPVAHIAPLVYATDMSANGTYLKKSNVECAGSQGLGILMDQNCTFLLDDGDELRISDTVTLIYYSMQPVVEVQLTAIQERERNVFASRYLLTGRLLGEGGYGKVLVGVQQETQRQLACKIIKLDHMYEKLAVPNLRLPTGGRDSSTEGGTKRWPTRVANCFREFDILKDLSHPNIVAVEKVFWSHNTIYIFEDLVTGGDLFSFLEFKGGRLDSSQAAVVVWQILKGVEYLHDQDVVHRDIKPDNILMTSLEQSARAVITDFGNARFLPSKNSANALENNKYQRMFSYVGTLEFTAPEVHRANRAIPVEDGYSKSIDMWSIGSVTAAVLTGDVIFTDRAHPNYYEDPRAVIMGLAAVCDLSVLDESDHPLWSVVDTQAKDFIKGLLVLREEGRMTASEALAHSWFANDCQAEYERSIQDWEPRPKNSQLVERISKSAPNFAGASFAGHISNQGTVSHFFPRSPPGPTHNMLQKLSSSQCRRANTPLPSIREDYEQAQFASQVQPPSYDTNDVDYKSQQHYDHNGCSQDDQPYCAGKQDESESQLYEAVGSRFTKSSRKTGNSIDNSMSQLSLSDTAAPGMYLANEATKDEDSYNSGESLNKVTNVYSQQGYCIHARQPQDHHEAQESILVSETPITDQVALEGRSDQGEQADDSYQQTQFPDEHRRYQALEEEQDSILVLETPPDVFRKRPCSPDNELPSYQHWVGEDHPAREADLVTGVQAHGKRRRLSHYHH